MRRPFAAVAIAVALGSLSLQAAALGVGRVVNNTTLGQPLDFTATLRLDTDEVVTPDCVGADVVVGDRALPQQAIRVLLSGDQGSTERRVRVTTLGVVDEPVVSVTLKVGCPTTFLRNFVAFVDPPGITLAQAAPAAATPVTAAPDAPSAPSVAPVAPAPGAGGTPSPTPGGTGAPATAGQGPLAAAPARRIDRNVQRPPVAPETRPAPAPQIAQARPAPSGPRLKLDPAVPVAPPTPAVPAPPPPTDQATDAAAAEAAARREAEEAALRALEQSLTALRNEALSTQRSVAILQARLAAAEAQRYQNWLVYTLAAAVVLLAIALLVTVQRLRSARRDPGWWNASAHSATAPEDDRAAVRPSELVAPGALTASPMSTQPAAATQMGVSGTASMPYLPTPSEALRRGVAPSPTAEARREVTVEELIDLEQQAEFFLVLGQDDAAIDVLMGHLRSTGGASPLPYLKLLEIYRRREDRDAYQRIRDRFNRRFNAYAPEWGSDLQQGRSLEDYPDHLARLQAEWTEPAQAMETLEASLLRQEEGAETFDLPAYREILFLYSIARDLAEHDLPETVDLLLPLGDDGVPGSRTGSGAARAGSRAADPTAGSTSTKTDFERSERYDVDFQFGSGSTFTGTGSRGGGTPRKS
jgi:pilus assembly protein FimV